MKNQFAQVSTSYRHNDIFGTMSADGSLMASRISYESRGNRIKETTIVWAPADVLEKLVSWKLNVRTIPLIRPGSHQLAHTLYLPMNRLRDFDPTFREDDIHCVLAGLMKTLVTWKLLGSEDYDIRIVFRRDKWFGFINLNKTLGAEECIRIYTYLRSNRWNLRCASGPYERVTSKLYIQYAKK